jgi:ribosomal-protein-alanine N-acetyltransferase
MKCPETVETKRLVLRRPRSSDALSIFENYAGDPLIGQYLAWPIHNTVSDTEEFIEFSDSEWTKWPAGPYLIFLRDGSELIGSTGLAFEGFKRASTGYVIARQHWGFGYATEALHAIQTIARATSLASLYAMCHPQHPASQNVLRKCEFDIDERLENYIVFPNQELEEPQDILCFNWFVPEKTQFGDKS